MLAETLQKRMARSVWHVGSNGTLQNERINDHGIGNGNLQAKILSEKRDVLKMPYHRRIAIFRGTFDFNHIETVCLGPPHRTKRPQIIRAGPKQDFLLGSIHGVVTRDQGIGSPGLYLDKNQDIAIAANEIDFIAPVTRAAPVLGDDFIAIFRAKKSCRQPLALGASHGLVRSTPARPPIEKP